MAYIASSDVKAWGGVPNTDSVDDSELTLIIARAQAFVDEYTGRTFECSTNSTRYYTTEDVEGSILWLDRDLNTIGTDGITAGTDALSSSDYTVMPRNESPYYGIKLTGNTPEIWGNTTSDGDYEDAIQVHGQWAYSSAAPADIQHAMLRLTKYYYNQGRLTDETANRPIILESGATVLPGTVPNDIIKILENYMYRPVRS